MFRYTGDMAFIRGVRDRDHFLAHHGAHASAFDRFDTPEDIIEFLSDIGFKMDHHRRRPAKRLQQEEILRDGLTVNVVPIVKAVLRVFRGHLDYAVAFLSALDEPYIAHIQLHEYRRLMVTGVEPDFAARMFNGGCYESGQIIWAWKNNIPVEYVLAV